MRDDEAKAPPMGEDAPASSRAGILPALLDRRHRTLLERVLEASPVAIAVVEGAELRFTLMNAAYRSIAGARRCPEVGLTYPEVFPEAAERGAAERLREVLRTGEPWRVREFKTAIGDRPETWWDAECLPLEDDEGIVDAVLIVTWDVTERRTNERLRESEAMFRALSETLPNLVWMGDGEGRPLYQNPAWRAYTGLTGERLLAQGWETLHHPDEVDAFKRLWIEALARGTPFDFEGRMRRHDGELRWWSGRTLPIRDESGKVVRWVGTLTDIDARKRAEEQLRESERRLEREREQLAIALRTGELGVYEFDVRERTIWWSPETYPVFGVDPASFEVTLESFNALIHPDDRAELWRKTEESLARRDLFKHEYRIVRPDGTVRWIYNQSQVSVDANGEVERITGVASDITERKAAEQALRDSEERFRTLADHMSQLAWMADARGDVFWYNRRWYEYTGTRPEDMLGAGWRSVHHPDHVSRVSESLQHSWDTGEPWEDTFPLRSVRGEYRWFLSRAVPIRDDDGRIVRWFGTHTDITEQRELDEALKEADRKKDEFLGILAHELRNPLAPIRNGLQIMKLAADNAELIERSRSIMERQLGQMVRLIDDLMDLTRISQGKLVLQKTRMPIAVAVRDAVDASRPLINQHGHDLVIAMPDDDLYVDGDGTRLAQVFANLLNNAAKYTDKGGRIRLNVERRGADVVVSVTDNGIGIPAAMLPKVFDMFTQVDRSLERAQGGLGLGLCIVKRLVEMHGGRVEAASEGHGRGSRFVVCLPLAQLGAGLGAELGDGRVAHRARRRILVVDDNRDGAVTLAEMLGVLGNEARTAHDGLEALAVAEAFRPDVILMDIGMPGLNGYDACRRIRQEPWGKHIVVVAQTGWGQEDDRKRSEQAGFDFHLVKPIDPAKLEQVLAGLT